jgi:LmbE family N-acetylglucosaminyl deacetylase
VSDAVPELGTILSVWAHPDDETYGCAGIMAAAVRAGNRVVCVTATRGEQGSTDPQRWPNGPELAEVRTQELAAALEVLGVREHVWLDYPDGGCAAVDRDEAVARIRAIVEEVRPDTVLTFGPDGGTFHPDHIAVSGWTTEAVRGTGAALLYASTTPEWRARLAKVIDPKLVMMTDDEPLVHTPDQLALFVRLEGEQLELKYAAIQCQESQIGPLMSIGGPDLFRQLLSEEAFRDSRGEGRD